MGNGNGIIEVMMGVTTFSAMASGSLSYWVRPLRRFLLSLMYLLAIATVATWLMYFFQVPAELSEFGVLSLSASFVLLTLSVGFFVWGALELRRENPLEKLEGVLLSLAGLGLMVGVLWLQSGSQIA